MRAQLLLLDDDPDLGVIVGILARKAGQQVTWCRDVEAAWAALHAVTPDLTLLDVNLAGESGLTFLTRLRADPAVAPRRVALFCQSALVHDIAAGWASGADYLVTKDLVTDPTAWRERLAEVLAHANGQLPDASLHYPWDTCRPAPVHWEEALNRVAEEPLIRSLGGEVVEQLRRRALARGFGIILQPDSSYPATPEQVQRVLLSYLDQVWCLLGARAFQACAERLTKALVPGGDPSPRNGRA